MPKLLIIIVFFHYSVISVFPQKLSPDHFWIPFTDKAGSPYSINNPDSFLSERSVHRRLKYGIPVSAEDLPVNKSYVDSLVQMGFSVIGTSRWFNSAIVKTSDTSLLNSLKGVSFIGDLNYKTPLRSLSRNSVSIPYTNHNLHLTHEDNKLYGFSEKQIEVLKGKELHASGYKGKGLIIAVIDAGFYLADSFPVFDSLWLNDRIIGWHDFAEPGNPYFFIGDLHGSSVLSTMGANLPGQLIGTAPEASYLLLRTEITGSEYLIEEALWLLAAEYADSTGADIINSSLGYTEFDDTTMDYTSADMNGITAISTIAAEKAFSKGMIVVSSAGNEGNKPWKKISAPADGKNVLAVGAIDTFRNLAPFSSVGPSSDHRVKPDILAVGWNSAVIDVLGSPAFRNGTSFSSPQIAGLTACLWQAFPEKTNLEIINTIRRSSSFYYSPDNNYGYGIPDFSLAFNYLRGLTDDRKEDKLLIIPNPNHGIFEIRMKDITGEIRKVNIYDLMGRLVAVINNPEIRSDYIWVDKMTGAQPGLYYIVVSTGQKDYSAKMIKLE